MVVVVLLTMVYEPCCSLLSLSLLSMLLSILKYPFSYYICLFIFVFPYCSCHYYYYLTIVVNLIAFFNIIVMTMAFFQRTVDLCQSAGPLQC